MNEWKFLESLKRQIEQRQANLERPDRDWDRIMLTLLAEIDRRPRKVSRAEVLEIGEQVGLRPHGLGGYYQRLLTSDKNGQVALTNDGRARLATLRKKGVQELPLPVKA